MEKFEFNKIIDFGKIIEVSDNLVILKTDDMGYSLDIGHYEGKIYIKKEEYNDFSDLKVGEECVIFHYSDRDGMNIIHGVMNKNKHDNAVRDSQRLPKGWIHEPYYTIEETHGIIRNIDFDNRGWRVIKILFDLEHYITVREKEDCIRTLNFNLGENVVIIKKVIFLPNGKRKEEKQLWNKKAYLAYIEDYNERKKEEEYQNSL